MAPLVLMQSYDAKWRLRFCFEGLTDKGSCGREKSVATITATAENIDHLSGCVTTGDKGRLIADQNCRS